MKTPILRLKVLIIVGILGGFENGMFVFLVPPFLHPFHGSNRNI